jgi:hypothetical protein
MVSTIRIGGLSLLLLMGAGPVAAQTQAQSPPAQSQAAPASSLPQLQTAAPSVPPVPADLTAIKKALAQPSTLNLVDKDMRYYVMVTSRFPTFEDIVGSFDLRSGPTPYGAMTHQEFIQHTRPNKLYSAVGFRPIEALYAFAIQAAANIAKKGLVALKEAKTEHERQKIREQIDRELAALALKKSGGEDSR